LSEGRVERSSSTATTNVPLAAREATRKRSCASESRGDETRKARNSGDARTSAGSARSRGGTEPVAAVIKAYCEENVKVEKRSASSSVRSSDKVPSWKASSWNVVSNEIKLTMPR